MADSLLLIIPEGDMRAALASALEAKYALLSADSGEPVRFVEAKRYTDAPVTDGKEYVVGIRPENIVIRPEGRFSGRFGSGILAAG